MGGIAVLLHFILTGRQLDSGFVMGTELGGDGMIHGEVLLKGLVARLPPLLAVGGIVGETGRRSVGIQGKPEGT